MANRTPGPRIGKPNLTAPRVLSLLWRGKFSPMVMRERLNLSPRTLRYSLKKLRAEQKIVAEGNNRNRVYQLVTAA